MLENSFFSVISPEGAAAIILKDSRRAEEISKYLKLTSYDLLEFGIIDEIIKEPKMGLHNDMDETINELRSKIYKKFRELLNEDKEQFMKKRYMKIRTVGSEKWNVGN